MIKEVHWVPYTYLQLSGKVVVLSVFPTVVNCSRWNRSLTRSFSGLIRLLDDNTQSVKRNCFLIIFTLLIIFLTTKENFTQTHPSAKWNGLKNLYQSGGEVVWRYPTSFLLSYNSIFFWRGGEGRIYPLINIWLLTLFKMINLKAVEGNRTLQIKNQPWFY